MKGIKAKASVLLFTFALTLFFPGAVQAAVSKSDIIFVGISGILMPLHEETMPFVEGNQTYVPAYLFSDGLGVRIVQDAPDGQFVMSYFGKALVFSKNSDVVYDGNLVYFQNRIHKRNNTYFVPLEFTCERLELPYRIINTTPKLIRLRQAEGDTNDRQLLELFARESPKLVNDFMQKFGSPDNPSGSGDNGTGPGEVKRDFTAYLLFTGGPNERTAELLDILATRNIKGTFFLQGNLIEGNETLVRRIVIEGHGIGIASWSGSASDFATPRAAQETLERTNNALDRVLHTRTRIVCPAGTSQNLSAEVLDAVIGSGYRYWDRNIAAHTRGNLTSRSAVMKSFTEQLESMRTTLAAELRHTAGGAGILRDVLAELGKHRTAYLPVTDLVQPVNLHNDTR